MKLFTGILLTGFLLQSCLLPFTGLKQTVKFTSNPSGAEVIVNGKSFNNVTPCKLKVPRTVKKTDQNKTNEQLYIFRKEGYYDAEVRDRRAFNPLGAVLGYLTGGLSLVLDLPTGAAYIYDNGIHTNLNKKSSGEIIVVQQPQIDYLKERKLPKIHAVIIGVSAYSNQNLNLEYADDDARLFYDFMKGNYGDAAEESQITLLQNEKATRANVIKALNAQFREAYEEDLVLVYIASHGLPSSSGNELYFLGSDTDIENLEGTGISQSDIQKALMGCKAKKKIWIADACHSGGLTVEDAGTRGMKQVSNSNMVDRFLTDMASYDKNLIIITASSAGQVSQESSKWGGGHGVFTYYLTEGLKGEADENKNSMVDIRELFEFVRNKVSAETGKKQFPELKGSFNDKFPMSFVK